MEKKWLHSLVTNDSNTQQSMNSNMISPKMWKQIHCISTFLLTDLNEYMI